MFAKKKTSTITSPEKFTTKIQGRNKHNQKQHSRGCSRDNPWLDISSLVLKHFRLSSKQMNDQQHISNIDSLFSSHSSNFAVNTKETTYYYCPKGLISNYYIFSKNQEIGKNKLTIQNKLVQLIRSRSSKQTNRPLPHFQAQIYPILKRYLYKKKRLMKKQEYLGEIQVQQSHKAMLKELPTAFSEYSQMVKQTQPVSQNRICRSQSFQLKALTECIKQMFSKQNQQRSQLGVTIINDNSWFGSYQNDSKRQFIECDFSAIEANSRFDLHLQSRDKIKEGKNQIQSNYGLQDLKRKYENMRLSQISQEQEKHKPLGHKRNPTDVISQKKSDFYGSPMTPKDHVAKSQFGSSNNIPLQTLAITKKKTHKSKQKDVYQPYMLKFDKKKTQKKEVEMRGPCKQNLKSQRKKSKKEQIRSKSKSSKKSIIEPFKKRMQTQY